MEPPPSTGTFRRRPSVVRYPIHSPVGREERRDAALGAGQAVGSLSLRSLRISGPGSRRYRQRRCSIRRARSPPGSRDARGPGERNRPSEWRHSVTRWRLVAAGGARAEPAPGGQRRRRAARATERTVGRSDGRTVGRAGDRPADRPPVRLSVRRPSSAAANSAALANRSAGSFSSAVSTASSTASGTRSRRATSPAGFSVITLATIACAVGPVNGGSPISIS